MKTFFQTLRQHRYKASGFLIVYALLSVVISVCGVLTQHFTGELSQAALDFDLYVLTRFLGVMAIMGGASAVSEAVKAYLSGRFSGKTDFRFRERFARHFTRVKYAAFTAESGGSLLSVYTNDLPRAAGYVSESVPGILADVLYIVFVFVYMATIQPVYTLIFFLLFPVLIAMQAAIAAPIQKKAAVMSAGRQQFNAVVNDSLQNIPAVVAYSLEQTMEERYLASYDKFFEASKTYLRSLISLVMSGMAASMLPVLFIFGVSGYAVVNGSMSFSEFVAFTSVSSLAANWIIMLSQQLQNLSVNAAGADKLNQTVSGEEEKLSHSGNAGKESKPLAFAGMGNADDETAIEFSGVTFSYANANVLNNISFKIKKGSRAAIVGESGSGKSTLLKLLLNLYEPSGGKILLFGKDIQSVPADSLRSNLAYVPQDSFMFPESIRENLTDGLTDGITDGRANITEEKLRAACQSAGILDFINALPDGFDTVLSESAENVSGGQRQRLAIARAYLQDAPVVLFDEATAALDPATEAEVLQAFLETTRGKTVIMVAHRAAAINACDAVIRMENL